MPVTQCTGVADVSYIMFSEYVALLALQQLTQFQPYGRV